MSREGRSFRSSSGIWDTGTSNSSPRSVSSTPEPRSGSVTPTTLVPEDPVMSDVASRAHKYKAAKEALSERFQSLARLIEQRRLDALNELDDSLRAEIETIKHQRRQTAQISAQARSLVTIAWQGALQGLSADALSQSPCLMATSAEGAMSGLDALDAADSTWREREAARMRTLLEVPVRRPSGIKFEDGDGAAAAEIAHMVNALGQVRAVPNDEDSAALCPAPPLTPLSPCCLEVAPLLTLKRGNDRRFAVVSAAGEARALDVSGKVRSRIGRCVVDSFIERRQLPTRAEMQQYNAILVWVGGCAGFDDSPAFAEFIEAYVETGGGLVVCPWALDDENDGLRGSVVESGWLGTTLGECVSGRRMLWRRAGGNGAVHPLLTGVDVIDGGAFSGHHALQPSGDLAECVASWSDGSPLAVVRRLAPGSPRFVSAVLNLYPVSSDCCSRCWDTATDYALLMANALHFVARP
eukprot:m51a1_g383 hypothetical protein (468) ;mRNA; f:672976-674711